MAASFEDLQSALKKATQEHYHWYIHQYPGEDYYGYSLYTDDGVSSIGPVATRGSALSVGPEDPLYSYYKYGPHEWSEWSDRGLFDEANALLKVLYTENQHDFPGFRKAALEAALNVLKELEAEGLFGPRDSHRFIVLWLSDSGDPIMGRAAQELNNSQVYDAYACEYAA